MTVPQQWLSRTLLSYHGEGQWVSNYQKCGVICAPVQNKLCFLIFTPHSSFNSLAQLPHFYRSGNNQIHFPVVCTLPVFNLTCTTLHFYPPLFICICLRFTVMQIHQLNFVTSYGRRRGKPAWRWSLPVPDPPNRWSTLHCLY